MLLNIYILVYFNPISMNVSKITTTILIIRLPQKNSGEHTVAVVSIHPSSYLLNLSSEIDIVDNRPRPFKVI
jgi:hypothetical protein